MNACLDCLPCFVRQTLDASRQVSDERSFHEKMLRELFRVLADADYSVSPPVVAQYIHRKLREETGVDDLYRDQKAEHTRLALDLLPDLEKRVQKSDDPLICAAHFAIAGNIIDLGAKSGLVPTDLMSAVEYAADEPLVGDVDAFRQAVADAEKILYLGDNAGEIVFDRLLIEQIGSERVTFAVRGGPVINDAVKADAVASGLHEMIMLLENGSDVPGTDLAQCSEEFCSAFESSDLIISKGQGNYETLSDVNAPLFFLFKVKCPVVAERSGKPLGAHVLMEASRS